MSTARPRQPRKSALGRSPLTLAAALGCLGAVLLVVGGCLIVAAASTWSGIGIANSPVFGAIETGDYAVAGTFSASTGLALSLAALGVDRSQRKAHRPPPKRPALGGLTEPAAMDARVEGDLSRG